MEYVVRCNWDNEAGVWYSESEQLPVVMESDTFDSLVLKIKQIAPEIAELNHLPKPKCIYFLAETRKEI